MSRTFRTISLALFLLLLATPLSADWINLTGAENAPNIAEIEIEKDAVTVKLEVFVASLGTFVDLLPDDMFGEGVKDVPPQAERLKYFQERGLKVFADGEQLPVELVIAERRMRVKRPSPLAGKINPYTRQIIPGPPEDKRVLFAELRYPYKSKPDQLVFIPPLDDKGVPEASIGFTCRHLGVPVVDFRFLSAESKLALDWDDPWYSEFNHKALRRFQRWGISTFLYIEPYEVRHETLARVRDLEEWLDFGLRGDEYIEEDEFDSVRDKIKGFLLEKEKVLIDGESSDPIVDKVAFVESTMLRSRFIDQPERVRLNTAMVGVVFAYPVKRLPDAVSTEWQLFSERITTVPARMTDPAGPFPYSLSADDRVLKWKNHLVAYEPPTVQPIAVKEWSPIFSIPLLSVACFLMLIPVGGMFSREKNSVFTKSLFGAIGILLLLAGMNLRSAYVVPIGSTLKVEAIEAGVAKEVLHDLLRNVYRSFDFRKEEDVYDRLAHVAKGDLLKTLYLESRKSLIVEQAGGAQAKVQNVTVESADFSPTEDSDVVRADAEWSVVGTVGHWGHTHTRENRYRARLALDVSTGSWKLSDMEVLEMERRL